QGDATAQYNLGFMYAKGEGVPKDDAEAVKWYRKAADQGLADAQYNLGVMYAVGKGVPKDDAEAVKWYRKAADQGLAGAQYNLGLMYRYGMDVPKDAAEAYAWYNLAAVSGGGDSFYRKQRDEIEKTMSPGNLVKARARANELKKLIEERRVAKGR
ncbi:MAG: sel1 repeat family protein, partial [Deltaproteobacteria bacterium]|nr:sel1 repeat family protein [Deltaproteobacteria bacterium]